MPGVDVAAPRVAISTVSGALVFNKPNQVVEQGDYVSWRFIGTLGMHTTTSGSICGMPTGLWDSPLNSTNPQFTRQFLESPGDIPYYCTPHCPSNMRGTVTVTTPIDLRTTDTAGTLTLIWSGGGVAYAVFRSDAPTFAAAAPPVPPDAGDSGTVFTDTVQPATGSATFYLVMNKQP